MGICELVNDAAIETAKATESYVYIVRTDQRINKRLIQGALGTLSFAVPCAQRQLLYMPM